MCMQKDKVWLECNHRAFFRFERCPRFGKDCFGAGGDHDEVHVQDICADCKRKDPNPAAREAERVRREMEHRARRAEQDRIEQIKRQQSEIRRRAEEARRKQEEEEAIKVARRTEKEMRRLAAARQVDNEAAQALESHKRKHEGGEDDEPTAKRQRGGGGGGG